MAEDEAPPITEKRGQGRPKGTLGGGRPSTGGRKPKGTGPKLALSKAAAARHIVAQAMMAGGKAPLEVLLYAMRYNYEKHVALVSGEHDAREAHNALVQAREAAKEAAPYVHPKLQSTELKNGDDKPFQVVLSKADQDA